MESKAAADALVKDFLRKWGQTACTFEDVWGLGIGGGLRVEGSERKTRLGISSIGLESFRLEPRLRGRIGTKAPFMYPSLANVRADLDLCRAPWPHHPIALHKQRGVPGSTMHSSVDPGGTVPAAPSVQTRPALVRWFMRIRRPTRSGACVPFDPCVHSGRRTLPCPISSPRVARRRDDAAVPLRASRLPAGSSWSV